MFNIFLVSPFEVVLLSRLQLLSLILLVTKQFMDIDLWLLVSINEVLQTMKNKLLMSWKLSYRKTLSTTNQTSFDKDINLLLSRYFFYQIIHYIRSSYIFH